MLCYFNLTVCAPSKRGMYAISRMDLEDSKRLVQVLEADGLTDKIADWDQHVHAMSVEFVDKGESQFAAQNLENVRQKPKKTVVQYMQKWDTEYRLIKPEHMPAVWQLCKWFCQGLSIAELS